MAYPLLLLNRRFQGQVERYKGKGIVFYVDKSKIVGVLMWNIMGSQKYYLEDTIRQVQ